MAGVLVATAFGITSSLPTNVRRLSVEYPPMEDRSGRLSGGAGCALTEEGATGACTKMVVTSVRAEEVSFPSSIPDKGLARLKGTLTIPVGAPGVQAPRPAIVLVHGSGPNGRDETVQGDLVSKLDKPVHLFKELADFLVHQGLIVLRYDKRAPQFYPDYDRKKLKDVRWKDFEIDARDALSYLATRPDVDPNALVVAGHSEGGQLAPFIAHDNARVAAVIMLAGPIEDFEHGLLGQLERLARARSAQWDPIGAWQVRSQSAPYAACLSRFHNHYDPNEMCIGGGVSQAMLKEYMDDMARMPSVLAAGKSPVMVIQGSVDRNIDPMAVPQIGKALGARDHELHYVPGVSHDFVNVVEPKKPPGLDDDVMRRIGAFLASVKRP
jgi:alpha-beta hydrolase superfamily lysophospholipase